MDLGAADAAPALELLRRPLILDLAGPAAPGITVKGQPFGDVAQLAEHLLCKQGVVGSNPIVSTEEPQASSVLHSRPGDV